MEEERNTKEFWCGKPNGRDHMQDAGADGGKSKVDFREVGLEGVGWIDLAQNRNKLRNRFKRAI